MGRTTRKPGAAAAATVAAPADQTPNAPAAAAPAAAAPAAPDLAAIMALADGTVAADSIHQAALDAYRSADAKGRAAIRRSVDDASKQAIRDTMSGKLSPVDGMALAGHWQRTLDALSATPAKSTVTVDPREVIANRVATLRLAADLLAAGLLRPDGLDMGDASITAEWSDGRLVSTDIPTGTADQAAAERIAASKITRAANRHDIGAAIAAAFDGLDVGTELTVSQIITRAAAAGFDATPDWNGRVTARLIGGKNGSTVPNVAHARIGADRTHGGRKVA